MFEVVDGDGGCMVFKVLDVVMVVFDEVVERVGVVVMFVGIDL